MKFTTDNRGVSEVVGAILVFGLFVALLAVFQTTAIPAANEEVEYNHNQELQGDMIGLLEGASRTGAQGSSESVGVRTGTTYPSRLLFFNPRNPAGRISTVDKRNATVENITATDPTVRKYINGSTANLSTKRVQYDPAYNQYNNAPTTHLEYGVLYNDFGDEQIIVNPGSVVSGNSINLMFFAGNLSRSSASSVSVDTRPTSAPARTVTVAPNSSDNVTIRLPTRLSEEKWEEILDDEIQNGNVLGVRNESNTTVIIDLDPTVNRYSLTMPKIGIGSGVEQPSPKYLTSAPGASGTVPQGSVLEVSLEVRDKYNNPVRGETVNLSETGLNGDLSETEVTTDGQGQATVQYNAPSNPPSLPFRENIKASFARDPTSSNFDASTNPEDFEYTVTVTENQVPTGGDVDATITSVDESCEQDIGGLFDLLGPDEASRFNVTWDASIAGGNGNLSSARLSVTDATNGQLADSTRYDLSGEGSSTGSISTTLVDRRPTECGSNYDIELIVTSEGNKVGTDERTGIDAT